MNTPPARLFLDTNVFIIVAALSESAEAKILHWAGYAQPEPGPVEIVVSGELFEQILRVGRRLQNKDWGSQIVGRIWNDLSCVFVTLPENEYADLGNPNIPREDIGIYLTALNGKAECFVSSNREAARIVG